MSDRIQLNDLLASQVYQGELYSFQIIAILLGLENLSGRNNFGISLYQKWIASRRKREVYQSTVDLAILARSFQIHGFSDKFPLEIDSRDHLLNGGTHRTACSILYNVTEVPYVHRDRSKAPKYYGINYFKNDMLFSDSDVANLLERWEEAAKRYGVKA